MRKIFGGLLLALGGFLLVAAVLGTFWAPGVIKKTPVDVDTTTIAVGEAARLDLTTGEFSPRPLYGVSVSRVDSEVSSDEEAVFVSTSCAVFGEPGEDPACVDDSSPDLLTAGIDTFATDRETALSVDSEALPTDAVPHEGLVNKFPFDAEQTTYPVWDGVAGRAVDAVFDRTEDVDGLEANVYVISIEDEPIEIAEGVDGTYTDNKSIFVDPRTGSILDQQDDQQRYLADGTQVLDLQLVVTDESRLAAVEDARDNIASIDLVTRTIPLVGFIGGVLLLIAGFVLMRSRPRPGSAAPTRAREPVGAGR